MFSFMSREANISTETRPIIKIFSNLLSRRKIYVNQNYRSKKTNLIKKLHGLRLSTLIFESMYNFYLFHAFCKQNSSGLPEDIKNVVQIKIFFK